MQMIGQYVEYWNIRDLKGFVGSCGDGSCVVSSSLENDGKKSETFRENEKGICLRVDIEGSVSFRNYPSDDAGIEKAVVRFRL